MTASRLAHPVLEERFPAPVAHGLLEGQVGAGPESAGGLARQGERHDEAVSVRGPQVAAEQLGRVVHLRSAHIRHQAGLPKASSVSRAATSSASTGWNRKPAGADISGSFAICWVTVRIRS